MKLVAITGPGGKLVGVVHTHLADQTSAGGEHGGPQAVLRPQPEQTFREIEVPDDYAKLTTGELHQRVIDHLSA